MLFTSIEELYQAIDLSVGPAANASTPLAPVPTADPPRYSSVSSAARAATLSSLRASATSLEQRPSTSQATRAINQLFEVMPSQIQRDLAEWSETEPETDDEIPMRRGQNQPVCLFISCVSQHHYSQIAGGLGGSKYKKGMSTIYLCIVPILTTKYVPTEKSRGGQVEGGIHLETWEGREEIEIIECCFPSHHCFLVVVLSSSLLCLAHHHVLVVVTFGHHCLAHWHVCTARRQDEGMWGSHGISPISRCRGTQLHLYHRKEKVTTLFRVCPNHS